MRYCEDYNEPAGYLVGFNESPRRLQLELTESDGWPFLQVGGKIVYYTSISIADLPAASRAGKADEITITSHDLRTLATDEPADPTIPNR